MYAKAADPVKCGEYSDSRRSMGVVHRAEDIRLHRLGPRAVSLDSQLPKRPDAAHKPASRPAPK